MSDLTKAFDFSKPDYTLPQIPDITNPSVNPSTGVWNGYAVCEALYPVQRPPVPYGNQTEATSLVSEQGFKTVRGDLTEGRSLVFEMNGFALTNAGNTLSTSRATSQHDNKFQRWVAHQLTAGTPQFTISSALDGTYIASDGKLVAGNGAAVVLTVTDLGDGKGLAISSNSNGYLSIDNSGKIKWTKNAVGFSTYSVTYNN